MNTMPLGPLMIDVAGLDGDSPVFLVMDQQHRFEDGRVTAYTDQAIRMASNQVLAQAGTVQLPWQPHHGELIIHRAQILRGGETIDEGLSLHVPVGGVEPAGHHEQEQQREHGHTVLRLQ